jgi:hypothetical protein
MRGLFSRESELDIDRAANFSKRLVACDDNRIKMAQEGVGKMISALIEEGPVCISVTSDPDASRRRAGSASRGPKIPSDPRPEYGFRKFRANL